MNYPNPGPPLRGARYAAEQAPITMYLRCPECKTRYEIASDSIPDGGARVRCPRCRTVFSVSRGAVKVAAALEPDVAELASADSAIPGPGGGGSLEPGLDEAGLVSATAAPAPPEGGRDLESGEPPGTNGHEQSGAEMPEEALHASPRLAPQVAPAVSAAPSASAGGTSPVPAPPVAEAGAPPLRPHRPAPGARLMPAAAHSVVPGAPVEAEVARRIARALVSELLLARRDLRNEALREGLLLARLGPAILEAWDRYRERVGEPVAQGTRFFQEAVNDILGDGRAIL